MLGTELSSTELTTGHCVALQGQGYSAVADMHLADARESVCVMRPLLHLSKKELVLYCFFNQIQFFVDPVASHSATFRSINRLTDSFIADLSVWFLQHACSWWFCCCLCHAIRACVLPEPGQGLCCPFAQFHSATVTHRCSCCVQRQAGIVMDV